MILSYGNNYKKKIDKNIELLILISGTLIINQKQLVGIIKLTNLVNKFLMSIHIANIIYIYNYYKFVEQNICFHLNF